MEQRLLLATTLIAEVDTGVDLNSTADSPYYDIAAGYNAYTQQPATANGSNIADNSLGTGHGHGSTVADSIVQGIQAVESQPGAGNANVAIMPIRVTNSSGGEDAETFNAIIRGIFYAAYHGASVINVSIVYEELTDEPAYVPDNPDPSYTNPFPTFQNAIDYANSKGAVVVTGAGNNGYDIDSSNPALNGYYPYSLYPTADTGPNLIVAASTDSSGNLTSVTNYGPIHVNLGSPAIQNATSYAAGYISGVSGVAASLMPGLSAGQLVNLVESTGTQYPQLSGLISTGAVVSPSNLVNSIFTPTVATPATASSQTVTGTSVALSALGADVAGESALTYTWSVLSGPPVTFGPSGVNGTNAAKNITATFSQVGTYNFQVTIAQGPNRDVTSDVSVTVTPTPTNVSLSPQGASLSDGQSQTFSASVYDQFGALIANPPAPTWSVDPGGAGGQISQSGTYTAPASGNGTDVVRASFGNASQGASVNVLAACAAQEYAISAGASVPTGCFAADTDYSGGNTFTTWHTIDTSGVTDPAPQAVYQSERWTGTSLTYTIPNLTPGAFYTVNLDFSENYYQAAGQRLFNVAINGTQVLTNFDIFAAAGGAYRAVNETFLAAANASGTISIVFTNVLGGAKVDGIQVVADSTIDPSTLPQPSAVSLGQDDHDFANINDVVNPTPGPDGYQDVHIVLSNLATDLPITRVRVNRIGGGGLYQSDGSPWSWTAVVQRTTTAPGVYSSTADVYFQPNPNVVDSNQPYAFDIFYAGLNIPVTAFANVTDVPNLPMVKATSLGQDGSDFANINNVVNPVAGPDGYQDVHVVLSNLPSYMAISRVVVNRIGGGGLYESDGSPWSWSDVVQRASVSPGVLASTANVYFQPNPNVVDDNQPYAIDIYFVGLSNPVTVFADVTDTPNLADVNKKFASVSDEG